MKHYYHPQSRAVTTDWMLRELEADHEQVIMDYTQGENTRPEFRAINPMAKIPTLVDGDVVVTEAAAICAYLADKYPDKRMAPPVDSVERGRYYRYLFFPGTTLEPMFTVAQLDNAEISPQSAGWGDRERCMSAIEAMTPAEDWIFGQQFTAADVVFGGTVDFAMQFGWLSDPTDKVRQYVVRLKQRAAYRAAHDPSWYE